MNNETNYSSIVIFKYLLKFVRPYKWTFIITTVLRGAAELTWLYNAYALASIATFFGNYTSGESLYEFWIIITKLGLAILAYFGLSYIGNMTGVRAAKKVALETESRVYKHAFMLDIEWHELENTGSKVKRINRGAEGVNQLIRMWYFSLIEISVSVIGILIVMSRFDRTITILTCIFFAIYLFVSFKFNSKATQVQRQEHLKDEDVSGVIHESVSNVRTVKVMSMVVPLTNRLTKYLGELDALANKRIFWFQTSGMVKNFMGHFFRLAMISYIGIGITQGRYELGFVVLFYSYFSNVLGSMSRIAELSQTFNTQKQAVGRMLELLETRPNIDTEEGKVSFPANWKTIEIKNVSFSYGESKVLDDVSFVINRGEKIGVVGLSGAGKSTLFKLLLKERENYTGDILVDGIPLKTISKIDYFRHTAVVLQDTEVFNLSLKENITISNHENATNDALLLKAITIAHVDDFAKKLKLGVNTLIGEKGVKLSGGEKQRIGLARAVFKEPEILLLDEATSHLDVESEENIQDSLHQFFQAVTAIVIAHRLTTIKEMDKILMIEDGKIIEQGSFDELYKKQGRFYTLWEKQKL